MAAADMEFAAPAGKSSMVMAIWRSGGVAARESAVLHAMQEANTANSQVSNGFMMAVLPAGTFWERGKPGSVSDLSQKCKALYLELVSFWWMELFAVSFWGERERGVCVR